MSDLEAFFDFLLLVELLSLAVVSSVELPALYVACSASVSFVVLIPSFSIAHVEPEVAGLATISIDSVSDITVMSYV